MTLRFSVLIPAYNAEGHLARAVDSVLAQTLPAGEIIIVDDGSTDQTWDVIQSYGNAVIGVQQANGGLSAARNAGLARATGDFVVLLDADDEWRADRLEITAAAAAEHPDVDIFTTDATVVEPDGKVHRYYEDRPFPSPERQAVEILRDNFIFVSSAVRRQVLSAAGGFRVGLPHDSEYEAWVRLILSGSRAVLCPEAAAIYHRSQGSLSARRGQTHRMRLQVLDEITHDGPLEDEQRVVIDEVRRELQAKVLTHDALDALNDRDEQARALLWKAAWSGEMPTWKRPVAALAAMSPRMAAGVIDRLPADRRPRGS